MIEAVKSVLNTIRNNSITEFKMIFDQTKIKAEKWMLKYGFSE